MAFSVVFGMSLPERVVPLQQRCFLHKYIENCFLLEMKYSFVQQGITWEILSCFVFCSKRKELKRVVSFLWAYAVPAKQEGGLSLESPALSPSRFDALRNFKSRFL